MKLIKHLHRKLI